MGHRALVTYLSDVPHDRHEMADCVGTTYYSHWGANNLKLYHQIEPDDPFPDAVDDDPAHEGQTVEEIASEYLDYLHHEAYFVVDSEYNVTPFRTLWYELTDLQSYLLGAKDPRTTRMPEDGWRSVGFGALVEPRILSGYSEDGSDFICDYDQTRFKGAKDGLQALGKRLEADEDVALDVLNGWVYEQFEKSKNRIAPFSPFGKWRDEPPAGVVKDQIDA